MKNRHPRHGFLPVPDKPCIHKRNGRWMITPADIPRHLGVDSAEFKQAIAREHAAVAFCKSLQSKALTP